MSKTATKKRKQPKEKSKRHGVKGRKTIIVNDIPTPDWRDWQ